MPKLLPPALQGSVEIKTLADIAEAEGDRLRDRTVVLRVTDIDAVAPRLLDFLAWGLHVDDYSPDLSDATKRALIKDSLPWHAKKGSPWAVEAVLKNHGYAAEVVEWWLYDGVASRFKLRVDITGATITEELWDQIKESAYLAKNERSWLEPESGLQLGLWQESPLYVTPVVLSGEVGEIRPYG